MRTHHWSGEIAGTWHKVVVLSSPVVNLVPVSSGKAEKGGVLGDPAAVFDECTDMRGLQGGSK